MVKVGIIGGAGYTAGELLRILLHHPNAEIVTVMSGSQTGESVTKVHPDLEGETELIFSDTLDQSIDVVFLCSGHGKSKQVLEEVEIPSKAKIIDLSADFRLEDTSHDFIYGLPELNRKKIKSARHVANPGCFATCIQLSLLPLASAGLLNETICVSAITGSTGAGQNPTSTTHFSWRSNNASVYKAFTHQHLAEIRQSLKQLQPDFTKEINFIPMRGAFTRGILAACYLKSDVKGSKAKKLFGNFYQTHPFVHLSETEVDVKRVANTNKVLLHITKQENRLLVIGVIDNLTKGASGQAVQNMNVMFGLEETTGLHLKPSAF